MLLPKVAFVVALILLSVATIAAQPQSAPKSDEKAEQVLQKAIQAVGGDAYLKVQTVTAHGFFTDYPGGAPGVPMKFIDYISYPDRERTEFTGGGNHTIQTNDKMQGWLFDAAAKTLKDQTPKQVEDFRNGMRTSVENLLHGWWRQEGATLSYVGRREATLGHRNETIRLTYPDGFWIEYEFAAIEGTPAKIIYKRKILNPDTEQTEEFTEEDRLFKLLAFGGVSAPFVIDHFRNGLQSSRIHFESNEINKPPAYFPFPQPSKYKRV